MLGHALLIALASAFASGPARAAEAIISCEESTGAARPETVIYRLDNQGRLFRDRVLLSVFDLATPLARVVDDQGPIFTFAQHEWVVPQKVLKRRVWWVRDDKTIRVLTEQYDFVKQQVFSFQVQDICHHR